MKRNFFEFSGTRLGIVVLLLFVLLCSPILLMPFGSAGFSWALMMINMPARLIAGMRHQEFGAMPHGPEYLLIIGFWVFLAFVISWPIAEWYDRNRDKF